jgi:hypothetical protein
MSKKTIHPPPRPPGKVPKEFKRFEDFVRKVVTVPKSEIDKRDAEYHHLKESRRTSS